VSSPFAEARLQSTAIVAARFGGDSRQVLGGRVLLEGEHVKQSMAKWLHLVLRVDWTVC
jgi:hypothetical protein